MLDRDELPGYRVVSLCRTSNISKDADSSINRQDKKLQKEFEKLSKEFEAEVISTLHRKESASSMDRASIDKIEKMAKSDEFDILMVWAIHRLTRANPWETMSVLLTLEAHDIIIYSHRDGYFSWDDPDDATKLIDRVTNSREWRNEIVRGSIAGCRDLLANGHWPYGDLGYGLKDVDEDGIVVKEGYEPVISSIFEAYLDCEDVEVTTEVVQNHIENRDLGAPAPSEYQVENVLENELFVGELIIKQTGDLVREKEDLKIIDPSVFAKAKEISQKSDNDENDNRSYDTQEFPSFIYQLISRFGQEHVVENISAIRWCCPECQSISVNVSDTCIEFWDISLPKIYCNDCAYQGAAIRLKGLNEIDYSLPFVCPFCQRTAGFEFDQIDIEGEMDQLYKYSCGHCEEWFISDKNPDANHRALQSDNRIDIKSTQSALSDSDESNQSDSGRQLVTDTDVIAALQSLVRTKVPQSETAQKVIVTTARTLREDGPLTADELKSQLWCDYGGEYATKDSLWESTINRYFNELPGFVKPEYNQYGFEPREIRLLLEGYVESQNE